MPSPYPSPNFETECKRVGGTYNGEACVIHNHWYTFGVPKPSSCDLVNSNVSARYFADHRRFYTTLLIGLPIVGFMLFLVTREWQFSNITIYIMLGLLVVIFGNRVTGTTWATVFLACGLGALIFVIEYYDAYFTGMFWRQWMDLSAHTLSGILIYLIFSAVFPKAHPLLVLMFAMGFAFLYEYYEYASQLYIVGIAHLVWDLANMWQDITANLIGGVGAMLVQYRYRRSAEQWVCNPKTGQKNWRTRHYFRLN